MFSIINSSEYLTDLFGNLPIDNFLLQAPSTPEVATQINILQAFFLGLIQGITEFLPISSTAHLKVIPVVLGWGDPGTAFTAIIQLGSIVAVVWFFWQDLTQVVMGSWRAIQKKDYDSIDFRLALGICLGTIPILFFGLLIKILIPDYDNSPLRSLGVIAIASLAMAFLLGLGEKIGTRKRDFEHLTPRDGILMGLAEALALIPGVSRSGSTITAGLFLGLERATAARFSFLLGIPAITIAGIVELKSVFIDGVGNIQILPLLVGLISSWIFSYLSIAWLIRYLQSKSTWIFVWYRLAFGVAILTALWGGALNNI
ncbi:undecaprenyl-diphosphate phosphatase [Planktothrix paucivesiculata]|uniref:Undecaprenyl-diphosphatase n=1 Tax=Planktothrix paucivesiculata PCC 9631 TaxID=671071 RepID=A0A7Z9BWG5_9CYAN|nr:undecaprenyl-diphosphate phosphatase [Planktothrix paucivesiculata]VXD20186.1 Undecaprenyl-diphosphatase [Planktothrix paucivesiculata PCC 9631]